MYMLFAGRSVCIGKNCARGLEYIVVVCYFFLCGITLKATFVLNFKTDARVRLTFRAQTAVLFAEFAGLILHVPHYHMWGNITLNEVGFWPNKVR